MSDEPDKEARYLRAREVLNGAGWLFDRFVNVEMAKILASEPEEIGARETAYRRARVASEMKLMLEGEVQEYDTTRQLTERREQQKERRSGRPDIN